jgi:hypothetical protein
VFPSMIFAITKKKSLRSSKCLRSSAKPRAIYPNRCATSTPPFHGNKLLGVVWRTVHDDLPPLRETAKKMLEDLV